MHHLLSFKPVSDRAAQLSQYRMHGAVVPPSSCTSQLRCLLAASRDRADAAERPCILVQLHQPGELNFSKVSVQGGTSSSPAPAPPPTPPPPRWRSQGVPSWEEKEEKVEVTGAAAAKVEEKRGPGSSEHHMKGYTISLPHPWGLWPLQSPPAAPTPRHPACVSPRN